MRITIKEAAAALGQAQETIRMGLQLGVYPFGVAYKKPGNQNWSYTIFPAKFAEYCGIYAPEEAQE